jgi:hypothetical protein
MKNKQLIKFIDFYRHNISLFIGRYLRIQSYNDYTWVDGISACAHAILFPESKITIFTSTKYRAKNIISEIDILKDDYPILAKEISNIIKEKYEIIFYNGSSIKILFDNKR